MNRFGLLRSYIYSEIPKNFTPNAYGMGEINYGILSERILTKENTYKQNACNEIFEIRKCEDERNQADGQGYGRRQPTGTTMTPSVRV